MSIKTLYVLVIIGLFGGLVIGGIISRPVEQDRIGATYLNEMAENSNVANAVFFVYGIGRFYDTFLELLIFSTAVLGITIFSGNEISDSVSQQPVESHVVTASSSFLYPLVALFGIYLICSAHLGPGGGFAGGVVSGSGVLLVAVALGADQIGSRFSELTMKKVEYLILLAGFLFGVAGMYYPGSVYHNSPGAIFIVILNLLIGIKVFIGTWAILHFFVKHRGTL